MGAMEVSSPLDHLATSRLSRSRQFTGWPWQGYRWKADVTRFQPVQVRPQTDHPLASAGGRKARKTNPNKRVTMDGYEIDDDE